MTAKYSWEKHPDLPPEMRTLYGKLRSLVLDEGGIEERVYRTYLAFAYSDSHFVVVIPRKRSLRVRLWPRPQFLTDPKHLAKNIYGTYGEWGSEVTVEAETQIDDVMCLIRQSLESCK